MGRLLSSAVKKNTFLSVRIVSMNTILMPAMLVAGALLLADAAPVTVEAAAAVAKSEPPASLQFAITFGVCAAMLAILFGVMTCDEISKVRDLKKRNADIEGRYREVRADMLRELDRRHQAEQVIRAVMPPVTTTTTSPLTGTYTISSTFPPGTSSNVFPMPAVNIGEITLRASNNQSAAPVVSAPDQNHFARIDVPRRFLRLD